MIGRDEALGYHAGERPGKVATRATKPCRSPREMRLAYLPGAGHPSAAIRDDPAGAFRYTSRGNLVAVVSNGTAVPGLGDVGPLASKPMLEGMAVLLQRLADLDVYDLEIDARDPGRFVEVVRSLEPTFGAINIKDVAAPDGLEILARLVHSLEIPVLHENHHGTAVVAAAALLNALDLVDKRVGEVRVVVCGAGTVGTGCARLLLGLGVAPENLSMYDVRGRLHEGRDDLHTYQRPFARPAGAERLEEAVRGADVLLGASAGGVVTPAMVRSMAAYPIVFALATPEPEIGYDEARAVRRDVVVATALGQHPNAILDLLSVPYVLRGALDVRATRVTDGMLLAAARALADLAREEVPEEVERAYGRERFAFGPEYLVPRPIDPRIFVRESSAVARAAIEEGVHRTAVAPEAYEERLAVRLGTGRETLRSLMMRARATPMRVAFSEGESETVLRACAVLVDEGVATPILLGSEARIRESVRRLGLDLAGAEIVEPERSPSYDACVDEYFRMRERRGAIRATAARRLREPDAFAAMMVRRGDAGLMIAGVATHYADSLRRLLEIVGPADGVRRISSHYLVLLPRRLLILADCAVNVDPDAATLAEIALLAAATARSLGVEPRVALLSYSNFGGVDHARVRKVREAVRVAHEAMPDLPLDGEMQIATALDAGLREGTFPFCRLGGDANVLIFPDLQSGNLALQLLQRTAEAVVIGPVLMGARLPVHLLQYGATVEDVVHLATVGIVEASYRGG